MPTLWNKRDPKVPKDAVYIGRPSKWGNPFSHQVGTIARYRVSTRKDAIARYKEWFFTQPDLVAALPELRGKDLVCWCRPVDGFNGRLLCHGQILLALANDLTLDEVLCDT